MNLAALVHDLKPFVLVLLQPPALPLLIIVMGAGLLRQHRHIGRALLGVGVLGAWLACCEGSGQWLTRHWVQPPAALGTESLAGLRAESQSRADLVVLVLGGGARGFVPEYGGASLNTISLARLRYGVWLARSIGAPPGFSGGIGWNARDRRDSEAAIAARIAQDEYGLPLRWVEDRSRDTRENATLSVALLKAAGIKKLLLVTHDLHMPRAQAAFVEAAQGQIEIVAAPMGLRSDALSTADWLPSVEGFFRVRYAIYEWLGRKAGH